MEAASQKKKKKKRAAFHTTKKSLNVRDAAVYSEKKEDCSIICKVLIFFGAVPDCVLTKELLTDGLKVLVSKEDELLYAARVHSLDLPDM